MARKSTIATIAGLVVAAGPAMAQEGGEAACEAGDRNGMVATVICPAGLDEAGWRAAGELACGDELPCGAWIWEDPSLVPLITPERHDMLSREQITGAVAIWVAEDQQLLVIGKEAKN